MNESTLERPDVLLSGMLPLEFRLIAGETRPQVEVQHKTTRERWVV